MQYNMLTTVKKQHEPWLVGLSGLSTGLQIKGWPKDSWSGCTPGLQVRAPAGGVRQPINVSLVHWSFAPSLSPSMP